MFSDLTPSLGRMMDKQQLEVCTDAFNLVTGMETKETYHMADAWTPLMEAGLLNRLEVNRIVPVDDSHVRPRPSKHYLRHEKRRRVRELLNGFAPGAGRPSKSDPHDIHRRAVVRQAREEMEQTIGLGKPLRKRKRS